MIIEKIPSGPFQTNAYILVCQDTQEAAIIDPAHESMGPIKKIIEKKGYKVVKILLTHSHWDHIADVAEMKKVWKLPIFVHPLDQENLIKPGSDGIPMMFKIEGATPDFFLNDQDKIMVGKIEGVVMHTPGHSRGSVCFYFPSEKILISGDTLFAGSIGKTSFPTSSSEDMWDSLKKLAILPPDTKVYPGHGEATTIGREPWLDRAEEIFG